MNDGTHFPLPNTMADAFIPAEVCIVAIRTMIRQVSNCSTGDAEFDADINKSLQIALADLMRWYLVMGSEAEAFQISVPKSDERFDA